MMRIFCFLIGLILVSAAAQAHSSERQERLAEIQERKLAAVQSRRDLRLEIEEAEYLRERDEAARARRIRVGRAKTMRQQMLDRMESDSWHQLPHNGESSPIKRQYLPPYKPKGSFRGQRRSEP